MYLYRTSDETTTLLTHTNTLDLKTSLTHRIFLHSAARVEAAASSGERVMLGTWTTLHSSEGIDKNHLAMMMSWII